MNNIDRIIQDMSRIYSMFCFPRVTQNLDTGKISIENVWSNIEAKETYEKLSELLQHEYAHQQSEQRKQQ